MCSKGTNLGPAQQSSAGPVSSEEGGLTNGGEAAIGILTTLHPKRAIDTTGGSLPRREMLKGLACRACSPSY